MQDTQTVASSIYKQSNGKIVTATYHAGLDDVRLLSFFSRRSDSDTSRNRLRKSVFTIYGERRRFTSSSQRLLSVCSSAKTHPYAP